MVDVNSNLEVINGRYFYEQTYGFPSRTIYLLKRMCCIPERQREVCVNMLQEFEVSSFDLLTWVVRGHSVKNGLNVLMK